MSKEKEMYIEAERSGASTSTAQMQVYVLELEGGKFYVGSTIDPKRIEKHFNGEGAAWCRIHKPLRVVEQSEGGAVYECHKTLEYMRRYGWQNVRGYTWTQTKMRSPPCELMAL